MARAGLHLFYQPPCIRRESDCSSIQISESCHQSAAAGRVSGAFALSMECISPSLYRFPQHCLHSKSKVETFFSMRGLRPPPRRPQYGKKIGRRDEVDYNFRENLGFSRKPWIFAEISDFGENLGFSLKSCISVKISDPTTNARSDDERPIRRRGGVWGVGATPVKFKYGRTLDYNLRGIIILEKPLVV